MTIIKEYRIVLPVTVEEYQVGQLWSVAEASKENTGGGEGVEVIRNEPYDDENGKGQYTEKIFRMESKLPKWFKAIIGDKNAKNMSYFEEKAWNAYPYCKTVITNPKYMKENMEIKLETWHKPELDMENVHGLPADTWKKTEVVTVDIAQDIGKADYKEESDPCKWRSQKYPDRNQGLYKSWIPDLKAKIKKRNEGIANGTPKDQLPVIPKHMCAYKLITIRFKWRPLTGKIEGFGHKQQKRILTIFHRQVVCWLDQWLHLNMGDIRALEDKVQKELDVDRGLGEVKGYTVDGE